MLCRAMFPWHPPATFQGPLFLWHLPATFQCPLFPWHPAFIFQRPLFLWHSLVSFQGPRRPHPAQLRERRAQTLSHPRPHRHSPGKQPQGLRGQAPAPLMAERADAAPGNSGDAHAESGTRPQPQRGDRDQQLSLKPGVGGISLLLDGQGMSRAQESR